MSLPTQIAAAQKPDLEAAARLIFEGSNAFRRSEGRAPLVQEAKLTATAREFAAYMADQDDYGHEADGHAPRDRAHRHGYRDCMVSENIAFRMSSKGFTTEELAKLFLEGWKTSPSHRKNLLDAEVTETSIALAHSDDSDRYYAVQMFGRPLSMQVQFEVRNESRDPVSYRVGDQPFTLPPATTRAHTVCNADKLRLKARGKDIDERPEDGARITLR